MTTTRSGQPATTERNDSTERSAAAGAGDLALVIFVVLFYTNAATVAATFHQVPVALASCVTLLLALPLAGLIIRRHEIPMTATFPLMLLWLAVQTLSAAFGSDPWTSIDAVLPFLTEGLLLFLLVTIAIRSVKTLRRTMSALLVAGALMGGLSLLQETTRSYGDNYFGFAQTNEVGFAVGEDGSGKIVRPRLTGPIGEQNRYAQVLIVLVPIGLVMALHAPRRATRVTAASASALVAAGIVLSFSRGAVVAIVPLLFSLLLLRAIRFRQLVVVLMVGAAAIAVFAPDFVTRMQSLGTLTGVGAAGSGEADQAVVGRETSTLAALNAFLDHPVIGVGPGEYFRRYSVTYGNQLNLRHFFGPRRAHDLYLEVAADMGALGLLTFLALIVVTARQLITQHRYWRVRRPDLAQLAAASLGALVAYLASAVFLHLSYQRYFWFLIAIVSSTTWVLQRERGLPSPA